MTKSLNGVKNVNSNTVQFSFYNRQVSVNATKATYYSDVQELIHSIKKAKNAGFKVLLKPVVDVKTEDGTYIWRGKIPGSDAWFKSLYIPFMTHMARIAKQNNVDILSVGSELRDTEHKTAKWKNVIATVRREYKGQLTYVANHDVRSNKAHRYFNMFTPPTSTHQPTNFCNPLSILYSHMKMSNSLHSWIWFLSLPTFDLFSTPKHLFPTMKKLSNCSNGVLFEFSAGSPIMVS